MERGIALWITSLWSPDRKTLKPISYAYVTSEIGPIQMAKLSVEKRLLQAQSLMRKGALQDARKAAQSVLTDFPANKKAKKLLSKINQAHKAGPLAAPQADQDKIAYLVRLFESGDALGAADLANRYTKQFPRSVLVWNVAAAANKVLGRSENAIECFERVIQITPTDADAHFNLGVLLQEDGRLKAAADSYRRAIALRPNDAEAHNNLGKALHDLGYRQAGREEFTKAVDIDQRYATAHLNLGKVLRDMGRSIDAVKKYRRALEIEPGNYEAYCGLGASYHDYGQAEGALSAYDHAIDLNPEDTLGLVGKGRVLMTAGLIDQARECFENALRIEPASAISHLNLSLVKRYTTDDSHIDQLHALHGRADLSHEDRHAICFALVKAHEDLGNVEQCFKFLQEGNRVYKQTLGYSIEQDVALFEMLRAHDFSEQHFSTLEQEGANEPIPIFIVGMPRSGTSLTEQIIASHSMVHGAGELNMLSQFGLELVEQKVGNDHDTLLEFRQSYLSFIQELSDGQNYVVDKLPHNFRFIPLIRQLFPNAKVVHTRRDAAAVCWSNFRQAFPAGGLAYSNDLNDIVTYYQLYRDLMVEWSNRYGDHLIQLDYERLTEDQEVETRQLISDLGLDWEDACLSPHKSKMLTRTASSLQVKKEVYSGSSQKWRSFEPYLNGVFDNL